MYTFVAKRSLLPQHYASLPSAVLARFLDDAPGSAGLRFALALALSTSERESDTGKWWALLSEATATLRADGLVAWGLGLSFREEVQSEAEVGEGSDVN